MEKNAPPVGKITIDLQVLETITRLTTLAVSGVVRLTPPLGIQRLLGRENGIEIAVHDGHVLIDVYVVVESGRNMKTLANQIQNEVARAIRDIAGMEIEAINVHIEDVAPALGETESAR